MSRAGQWEMLIDEARQLLDRLDGQGGALIEAARASQRWDGYPSTAAGAGDSRGGGGGMADRVVALVDAEDQVHAGRMRAHLLEALRSLKRADGALSDASRPLAKPTTKGPGQRAPGCVNCARFDVYEVAVKAGRCNACYMFRYRSGDGRDAPESVVMARSVNSTRRPRGRVEGDAGSITRLPSPAGPWFGADELLDPSRVIVADQP